MAIDERLDRVEAQLQEEGQRVVSGIRGAIRALQSRDVELADEVIAFDDEIDRQFLGIEGSIQALLALQTPVARDLRLLLAMLHINLLLERSADGCVTIAKLSQLVSDVEPDPALVEVLTEMGERAEARVRGALGCFRGPDLGGSARPGRSEKWKLAAVSSLGSAALPLGINRLISSEIWDRKRPYLTHHIAHPWINSHDPSFPSDHASAAFAIAFAVLAFDAVAGGIFLFFALVISGGRLFIGAHYPSDVGAGLLIGLVAALLVTRLARPAVVFLVRRVQRLTDPVLAP